MSQTRISRLLNTRKVDGWILIAALVAGLLLVGVLLKTTKSAYYKELHHVGEERLNLYASTVQAEHNRFEYLPYIVAQDSQIHKLLGGDNSEQLLQAVNRKLEEWQKESDADTLYLMDQKGLVIASSNWNKPESFIGSDYHFRPYFKDAISGGAGRFFAVGVTTGIPGLFLSRPVVSKGEVIGVAVLKINMSDLEANWSAGGEQVWVSDNDGVIFLASNPQWRYRSLTPLSLQTRERLEQAQKYRSYQIVPLGLAKLETSAHGKPIIQLTQQSDARGARPVARSYMLHHREIEGLNWSLFYLSDLSELKQRETSAILISVLVAALFAVAGLFLLSRHRHQQQLESRVTQRTQELFRSNSQLKREIEERIRTEKALRQTHEELIHAERLGALGQISAELVHEISQPLQATRTYLASTQLLMDRRQFSMAEENLQEIDHLIRRVSGIITHLKTFAAKSVGEPGPVEIRQVIENALLVLNPRMEKSATALKWQPEEQDIYVVANEIKLEQILVNLIRNAIDAIEAENCPRQGEIVIRYGANQKNREKQGEAVITITDNGCGIKTEHLPTLFDPFFTTKPPGEGMGLGLSVSYGIIKQFGGHLDVDSTPGKGSSFKVTLPLATEEINYEQG